MSDLVGFREAVEHAGHAIMLTGRDGTIEYVNPAFEEITGYDEEEAVGKRPSLLKSGVHDAEFYVDLWQTILDGEVWEGQLQNRHKSGEVYPIEQTIAPIEDEAGNVVRFVAINRDISERVERERQLERSQKKYRSLIDAAPDAIVVADAETGEIVEVNRAAAELTGRSQSELVGSCQSILHPDDEYERYRQLFADHVESESAVIRELPDGTEIEVVNADGETTPVEINAQLIEVDGKQLFQGIFRDIYQRKVHERELRRQNRTLESFAHTVAHDLRNPLNVVQGKIELARNTGEGKFLEDAEQAANRMERLVEEVLELAKQGRTVLESEPVSLETCAETAWEVVDAPGGVLLVESDIQLMADETRLYELFENLLSNAVEHGGTGVSIRVGALDDGFYVADDGPGIPTDRRDRIFESGYTTSADGTGFGLAIVKQIIDAHDWEVAVTESTTGGARFEVTGVELRD
ncbi:PAS domain S-box protein [Halorussus amylolyticus]|uniref:PAS domain S-box protein n=1 Tax=Halorussus amylolyticus TaxID=1126242 RepID=UPI00138F2C24|nr:PAS domain S-box protein [Halorussus amylolyticus]